MPRALTLKNIPDDVYERTKSAADMHRRSLNSEAIVGLETVLRPGLVKAVERLARVRATRAGLPTMRFKAKDVDAFKREGWP